MGVNINEAAQVVIRINRIMQRPRIVNRRRMPGLDRLGDEAADKPIADWLAEERIMQTRCARGQGPMWEWSQLLIACDLDVELRLNGIGILAS